jgi:prepilin-type processing-associated H-X9-DG protein
VQSKKLTTFSKPEAVPSYADALCHYINPNRDRSGGCGPCGNATPCPRVAWTRHTKGLNMLFVDGHSKWATAIAADARNFDWTKR